MSKWKRDSIRQMKRSRKATLDLLRRISPTSINKSATQGEWSVKDVISHFVAWEEEAVRRLKLIRNGKAARVHFFDDMEDANRFNARAVSRLKKLSLKDMLKRAAKVREDLEAEILRLPDEEWDNSAHPYPVCKWLPEFAWTHEVSHRKRIQKWIKKFNAETQGR